MLNKVKHGVAAGAVMLLSAAPAFAQAATPAPIDTSQITTVTTAVSNISSSATGVVTALLGASLLLWAAAVGFKALRRGFR